MHENNERPQWPQNHRILPHLVSPISRCSLLRFLQSSPLPNKKLRFGKISKRSCNPIVWKSFKALSVAQSLHCQILGNKAGKSGFCRCYFVASNKIPLFSFSVDFWLNEGRARDHKQTILPCELNLQIILWINQFVLRSFISFCGYFWLSHSMKDGT